MRSRSDVAATVVLVVAGLPFAATLVAALAAAHSGLTGDQIVFFYVLPGLWLAGTAGAVLLLERTARLNLALGILSVGVAVAAAEVGLGLWLRTTATPQEGTSILSEVLRLRADGEDAFPKIPGNSIVDLNATLSEGPHTWHPITPAPGNALIVLCNENGPVETYRSDRFGFENPDDVWEQRPDLAIIGDSYTVGVCADAPSRLPARLRTGRRVLSLGVSGAGPLQQLATLRELVAPLAPPVVVWVYFEGNDLWDLGRERERPWLLAYLEPGHAQGLFWAREAVDARYRVWIDSLVHAESVAAGATRPPDRPGLLGDVLQLRSLRGVARFGVPFPSRAPLGILPEVLRRANADVAAWGGRLVLVYMPAYERFATLVGEGVGGRRELLAFAEAEDVPVVDVTEAFAESRDPRSLWYSSQSHPRPEAYALAAEAIERGLAGVR